MEKVHLNIPFMLISTRINRSGDTEKRFLTPFGVIDVKLHRPHRTNLKEEVFSIEISGDVEGWLCDLAIGEFKAAIMDFVWGILQADLEEESRAACKQMSVGFKGIRTRMVFDPESRRLKEERAGQWNH